MGLPFWAFFVAGAVTGQILVIVPLAGWLHCAHPSNSGIEVAVARAVSETLRICLEVESTSSTTSFPVHHFGNPIAGVPYIWIVLVGIVGIILGVCCLGLPLVYFWWRVKGSQEDTERADISPKSPQLSIGDLARNQLAELRVRRHALQPNRIAGVWCGWGTGSAWENGLWSHHWRRVWLCWLQTETCL